MTMLRVRHMHTLRIAASARASLRTDGILRSPVLIVPSRLYSVSPDPGVKNTSPSSSKPSIPRNSSGRLDEGYLSFTKSSLYKLTLPLAPYSEASTSPASKINSDAMQRFNCNGPHNSADAANTWEQQVERGEEPFVRQDSNDGTQSEGPQRVIFLLHSGQPLSYVSNLIRAEGPEAKSGTQSSKHDKPDESEGQSKVMPNQLGDPSITFHTSLKSRRRWSPATGVGDFLREAARVGSFTIAIGDRKVNVNVPTFEERTRFLRASLREKTKRIERLAHVKDECDRIARRATQRYAFAGAGIMTSWWLTVGLLTFKTSLGWDVMEPVTYLTGFGMVIGSYLWFLWHNREVSYRTVMTETTSRRQHMLYSEQGFNVDAYHELISEAKALRRAIKRVAWDYELDWDQGDTEAGRNAPRALEIVRREEERDRGRMHREEESEKAEDDAFAQVDDDADGRPDRKPLNT
ncbi:uncharacterized protein FOMMEDRAFT_167913 [Fomitiporia mediterranea MF3/22]|uniref:uncharacterized protein n=1 Tax=Fomitiporia mediterranea (strain MF3/22) TaxID=694068 RepID=UPI00044089E1|nr:uncharacterized protein FOMMEDRAFT_167913 [Fomitiporia mediterranea MF3/22]EJD02742.1 hypothetical protein FOMMEDRAFT_167913 [Fomitiporia mediterranea MF3/22]